MLTRFGHGLLAAAGLLLALALLFGNYYLLLAGSLPLFYVLGAASVPMPQGVEVERAIVPGKVPVGGVVRVEVRVRAARGRGLLEVHCPLPEMFALEEGTNLRVLRKARGPLDASFSFAVRCTKRGAWRLPPVAVEVVHALGVLAPRRGGVGGEALLEVKPRLEDLRRVRDLPGLARQVFPEGDLARTGSATTDFRELREYVHGDPPRSINWKATARRAAALAPAQRGRRPRPLVNEYEHEGRKTVWLFVDAARYMEVGSTLDNGFEQAVAAAGSVAKFYLDRGYQLGCYAYNARDQLVHPDTGTGQVLKVAQVLTALDAGEPRQTFAQAVERCRGFLARGKPLVVVVTRVGVDPEGLVEGVRRIRSLLGRRRRRLPVLVVAPDVYGLLPEGEGADAAALLRLQDRHAVARLRALGAAVVEWDPRRHPLASAVLWGAR